ncbi:MAG: alpha-galactosidase, partial [Abditibacteriota bacterium]|nr:alpha-galactosidase [Abditibacteriota bacterium]
RSEKTVSQKATEEGVTETRTVWFDPKTERKVERVAHRYDDFPALDYTIYITNTGSGKSPVLADFRAYDGVLLRSKGNVKLHWDRGGINSPRAFERMVDILGDTDKTVVRDAPAPEVACDDTLYGAAHYNPFMGKGSDRVSSYFNFEAARGGIIFCVGWPGQWSMDARKEGKNVAVAAGQAELEGALNPGETVRSPRMLIMPYKGDFVDGQNLWRRFYFAHATPKIDGKPPKARLNMSICEIHKPATLDYVKRLTDYGVKAEYVWQDASWYKCSPDPKHKQPMDWVITGNWETVSDDLRDSFAYCRKLGMKTMLWFEPERVYKGTDFCNNHPDWVISGDFPESWGGGDYGNLVDFSNPAAVNWFINRFDKLIKETGTDMYREDFNMSPLRYWQRVDDRKGFVENHHIQGHLRLWQTLKDRNPGLEIDSCASGGLRNDYETMCAALPVLRTDYEGVPDPEGHQASFFGSA